MGRDGLRRRSVRGVQAVRIGGQPVHHRVPVLRQPAAPARAEAAARARRAERAARGARRARRAARALGRGRDAARAARCARGSAAGRSARPYATIALVAVSAAALWVADPRRTASCYAELVDRRSAATATGGGSSRSQFAYFKGGGLYAFVALVAIGLFGWLLERRHGPAVVLALFLGAGVAGALVA